MMDYYGRNRCKQNNPPLKLQYRFSCMGILVYKNITLLFASSLFTVLNHRPSSENLRMQVVPFIMSLAPVTGCISFLCNKTAVLKAVI
jgi:hypothetical protein